jgi:dipeptidyl aminopeptidase/acylaminoacyl peptidase
VLPDTEYRNENENDGTMIYQRLAVSPDGRWLAYAGDRGIGVVDPESGRRRAWAMPWQWTVTSPSWTPDGTTITFLNQPMSMSGQPRPSGELRALDLAEDARLADSRRVTKDDLVEFPGIGRGFFVDAVTEANGRSALAIFATGEAQGEARALVRIDLRSGALSVVDGKLKEQHIGEIAYDASRRHRLVITGQYAWSGPAGVVRSYDGGKLLPLPKTRRIEAIAW